MQKQGPPGCLPGKVLIIWLLDCVKILKVPGEARASVGGI